MSDTKDLPRPPYDPELVGLLTEPAENLSPSLSLEMLREGWTQSPVEEMLAGRDIRMIERRVLGPDGEAAIVLAVFAATEPIISAPAIYPGHGGGMTVGFPSCPPLEALVAAGLLRSSDVHSPVWPSIAWRIRGPQPAA